MPLAVLEPILFVASITCAVPERGAGATRKSGCGGGITYPSREKSQPRPAGRGLEDCVPRGEYDRLLEAFLQECRCDEMNRVVSTQPMALERSVDASKGTARGTRPAAAEPVRAELRGDDLRRELDGSGA